MPHSTTLPRPGKGLKTEKMPGHWMLARQPVGQGDFPKNSRALEVPVSYREVSTQIGLTLLDLISVERLQERVAGCGDVQLEHERNRQLFGRENDTEMFRGLRA